MTRVLIVEDELMVADIIEEILISAGFEVCGIARGIKQALVLAEQYMPELAIIDVHLIDGEGPTIVPTLLQRFQTGIIYTTANTEMVEGEPGHVCLRKPFRLSMIQRAIEVALQRRDEPTPLPILLCDPS